MSRLQRLRVMSLLLPGLLGRATTFRAVGA